METTMTDSRADAVSKAQRFASQGDRSLRIKAKQAILSELTSHLQVKVDRARLHHRDDWLSSPNAENASRVAVSPKHRVDGMHRKAEQVYTDTTTKPSPSRIPRSLPESARDRRRVKISHHNAIHKYRPSYTWNRGGRLKELRIRNLARKFLYIWTRNAFGRVRPSVARSHYEQRILSWAFSEWHMLWWTARKEWRLSVRAELHNRYRLWNKAWSAWKQFVVEHKVKSTQKRIADQHAGNQLCHKIFTGWKVYIEMRHEKLSLYNKAELLSSSLALRHAWQLWTKRHQQVQMKQNQENEALQIWAYNLMAKVWSRWQERYSQRLHESSQLQCAKQHYHSTLRKMCLAAWVKYLLRRREKKEEIAYAERVNCQVVLRRCFSHWRQRWFTAHAMALHQHKIEVLAAQARCRRALEHWKAYVGQLHIKRTQQFKADVHYKLQLKRTGLSAFKLNIVQARLSFMRKGIAQEFRKRQLVQYHWSLWVSQCDEREELTLTTHTRRARRHYRQVTLTKMWIQWQNYVEWRKFRKDQYIQADAHFIVNTLPDYLGALYEHAQLRKRKRELQDMGEQFQRMNLQSKYFYTWTRVLEFSQDTRMMERMAILHHNDSVRKRHFKLWKHKTQLAQEEEFKMSVASEHHEVQLCKTMLQCWIQHTRDCKKSYHGQQVAARHWYLRKVGGVWTAWRQYISMRREKGRIKALADAHYHRCIQNKVLSCWQRHHHWWTEVLQFAQTKCNYHNQNLLRQSVRVWYHNTQLLKMQRQRDNLALQHFEVQLKTKVLQKWHRYAALHAHQKAETAQQVALGVQLISAVHLRYAFGVWRQAHEAAVREKQHWDKAVCHHNDTLKHQAMAAWARFTAHSIRKQLLMRQCIRLHNERVCRYAFLVWKSTYQEAQVTQEKTYMALWHWSQDLQRKVLLAWFIYAQERKRKASRIKDALEIRRRRLLREGATKWLAVATDLAQMRQKFAAQRGAERAHRVYQVVQRCASHWRSITAKRKAERGGGQPPPRPQLKPPSHAREQATVPPPQHSYSPARFGPRRKGGTATSGMAAKHARPPPRTPAFLIESLKRDGLYSSNEKVEIKKAGELRFNEDVNLCHGPPITEATRGNEPTPGVTTIALDGTGSGTSLLQSSSQFLPVVSEMGSTPRDGPSRDVLPVANPVQNQGKHRPKEGITEISGTSHLALEQTEDNRPYSVPLSVGFQSKYNNIEDFEMLPRPPLQPSCPTQMGQVGRGVSFLGLSDSEESLVSVRKESQNVTKGSYLPHESKGNSHKGNNGPVKLLPPSAFLNRKDGTSLINGKDSTTPLDSHLGTNIPINSSNTKPEPAEYINTKDYGREDMDEAYISPAEEMVQIRNRMLVFQENRSKLKQLEEQQVQLSSWLEDQPEGSTEPDVVEVATELTQLNEEMASLSAQVRKEKPQMQKLAQRVKQLIPTL